MVCLRSGMKAYIRQWAAALTCNLSVAMTGACFVWITPLMLRLTSPESPVPMTTTDIAWITALIGLGDFMSTVPIGYLADRYGRKTVMQLSAPLVFIGWVLVATTRSTPVLYIVRFIHGICIGISYTAGPTYLAEVTEPKIRGLLSGQFISMWYLGSLYSYMSGPYLSYNNYVYVCAILPIASSVTLLFVPESPYYYFMTNKEEKALKSLIWLRGGEDVISEFEEMKASVKKDMMQKGNWKDLIATRKDRKAFYIVSFLILIKHLGGMSAIMMYATKIFEEQFGSVMGKDEMTIILGVILFVSSFFGALLTDKVGRKFLLIFSLAGSAFFNAVVAVVFYLDNNTKVDMSSCRWISFVAILGFSVITNIGLGQLMSTIQAEYFPSRTRAIGGAVTGMVASFGSFVSFLLYQIVSDHVGTYMNYVLYSIIFLVGTFAFMKILTETTGKSLGQIQDDFENDATRRKNKSTV